MEQNPGRNMPRHKEMAMAKTRVAVLYGGKADEHSISCISAATFMRALNPELFEAVPIGITKTGTWFVDS